MDALKFIGGVTLAVVAFLGISGIVLFFTAMGSILASIAIVVLVLAIAIAAIKGAVTPDEESSEVEETKKK